MHRLGGGEISEAVAAPAPACRNGFWYHDTRSPRPDPLSSVVRRGVFAVKQLLGGLMLLLGVALGFWVAYNLLIARRPEAQGSPVGAILFSAGLIFVGLMWIRGKSAG
jgi:hypothetical protein